MATAVSPAIMPLLEQTDNQAGVSIVVLLAWLMKIDGEEAPEEQALIDDIVGSTQLSQMSGQLLAVAEDLDSVELACDILRRALNGEGKLRLLELYIGMLLADGYISSPEVFAIGFIADLFSISPDALNQLFVALIGRKLPPPADPSAKSWWDRKEQQKRRFSSREKNNDTVKRMKSLSILGLTEQATLDDIKRAYRRLAQIHHPDRFQSLGPEAFNAANATFARINDAYAYLTK